MKLAKQGMLGVIMAVALMAAGCGMGDAADDGTGTTRNNGTNDDYVNSVTNGTDGRDRTGDGDNLVEDAVDGARDIGDDVLDGARDVGDDVLDGARDIGDGAADTVEDAVRDRGSGADNSTGTAGTSGAGANGTAGGNGTAD